MAGPSAATAPVRRAAEPPAVDDAEPGRAEPGREEPRAGAPAVPADGPAGPWGLVLFGLWLAGAAAGALGLASSWRSARRCLATRTRIRRGPLPAALLDLCRRAGVRRVPRLSTSPRLQSPISSGILRPEIVVPERALAELTPQQQEVMLAHELAHVVRRDALWLLVGRLAERVFFFQPLHRVARRELQDLAEYRCDDWAVRQTGLHLCLARCLAVVAGWIVGERRPLQAPAMAAHGSRLGARIGRLLEPARPEPRSRRPWAGPALLCAAALAAPGAKAVPAAERAPASAPPVLAAPLADLDSLLDQLEGEIGPLEAELAELRRQIDASDALAPLRASLDDLERRAAVLRDSRDLLRLLLDRFAELSRNTNPIAQGEPR